MPSPESMMETKKWPDWDAICNASDADLKDHAWYQLRLHLRDESAPSVDKGKGRAANGDVHSMDIAAVEEPRGRTQTRPTEQKRRGRSHFHRDMKRIKLAPTFDSDETRTATAAPPAATYASASTRNRGLSLAYTHTPGEGFEVVEEGEQCTRCRESNFPCAVKPGRACWQCKCSKSRCDIAATGRGGSKSQSTTIVPEAHQPGTSRVPNANPATSCRQTTLASWLNTAHTRSSSAAPMTPNTATTPPTPSGTATTTLDDATRMDMLEAELLSLKKRLLVTEQGLDDTRREVSTLQEIVEVLQQHQLPTPPVLGRPNNFTTQPAARRTFPHHLV